jgi:hypothetical protein
LHLQLIQILPKLDHLIRVSGIGIGKTRSHSSSVFCYPDKRGSESVQRHSADPPGNRSASELSDDLFDLSGNHVRIDFRRAVASGSEVVRHLDTATLQWASGGVENIPAACRGSDVDGQGRKVRGPLLGGTRVAAFVIVPEVGPSPAWAADDHHRCQHLGHRPVRRGRPVLPTHKRAAPGGSDRSSEQLRVAPARNRGC